VERLENHNLSVEDLLEMQPEEIANVIDGRRPLGITVKQYARYLPAI
jgi:hypothetical protein